MKSREAVVRAFRGFGMFEVDFVIRDSFKEKM